MCAALLSALFSDTPSLVARNAPIFAAQRCGREPHATHLLLGGGCPHCMHHDRAAAPADSGARRGVAAGPGSGGHAAACIAALVAAWLQHGC